MEKSNCVCVHTHAHMQKNAYEMKKKLKCVSAVVICSVETEVSSVKLNINESNVAFVCISFFFSCLFSPII